MLPLRPPTGKPSALVCTYAATGHNSAVLSVDVTDDYMFTGSKGMLIKQSLCRETNIITYLGPALAL